MIEHNTWAIFSTSRTEIFL